ncbi:hypothetical protein H6A12_03770 [Phocea massiliensis]|uniref:Uncharacterized protein n=1 Tax=Merdimmobilis hominis TaxID=2897707 RepID=A0A939BDW6_9FIRM|nr:hypothetical protein [Merdimmobilis hominis]MBM6920276.1 hypothetical protein [Merdimmobilis hominis]
MKMKKYICLIAAVCLLGTAAFCGYHIYDHYADEAEQTEAFENIAEIVEQAQAEDGNAPEVPLTEEENILTEYGELYLKNTDNYQFVSALYGKDIIKFNIDWFENLLEKMRNGEI